MTPLPKCASCHKHPSNSTGCETRAKDVPESKLRIASDEHSHVNKHNTRYLKENNFPNFRSLPQVYNWHNLRKLNPTAWHTTKIDQIRQQTPPPPPSTKNIETKEILLLSSSKIYFYLPWFQYYNPTTWSHKYNLITSITTGQTYFWQKFHFFLIQWYLHLKKISQEDENMCLVLPPLHNHRE
jgi:hypothetical protein